MTTALRPLSALLLTGCSLTVTSESFPTPGADAGEPICLPSESTCDGRDDDCDGETDERSDLAAAAVVGVACGSDVGECSRGIAECVAGELVCQGAQEPAEETCNGRDDDCDGVVDEDFDLDTDVLHCGPCAHACDLHGAEPACEGGGCVVAACRDGFFDVDGEADNGCDGARVEGNEVAEVAAGRGAWKGRGRDADGVLLRDASGTTVADNTIRDVSAGQGGAGHGRTYVPGDEGGWGSGRHMTR